MTDRSRPDSCRSAASASWAQNTSRGLSILELCRLYPPLLPRSQNLRSSLVPESRSAVLLDYDSGRAFSQIPDSRPIPHAQWMCPAGRYRVPSPLAFHRIEILSICFYKGSIHVQVRLSLHLNAGAPIVVFHCRVSTNPHLQDFWQGVEALFHGSIQSF